MNKVEAYVNQRPVETPKIALLAFWHSFGPPALSPFDSSEKVFDFLEFAGEPSEARTSDPLIKSLRHLNTRYAADLP